MSTRDSHPSEATSLTLLEAARNHQPEAWDLMVRIYGPIVFRRCRSMDVSEEDAQDIVQDVFRKLLRKLRSWEPQERGGFRNWLRTMTRNTVIDFFRSRDRDFDGAGGSDLFDNFPEVVTESSFSTAQPSDTRNALLEAVQSVRGEFNDKTWNAFWRTTVDGQNAREVGEELGMGHGAVRMAKSRVLGRLKDLIGDFDTGEETPE